jgi:hypothetical protein
LARLKKLQSFCWRLLRCVFGALQWGARGAGAPTGGRVASILKGGTDQFQPDIFVSSIRFSAFFCQTYWISKPFLLKIINKKRRQSDSTVYTYTHTHIKQQAVLSAVCLCWWLYGVRLGRVVVFTWAPVGCLLLPCRGGCLTDCSLDCKVALRVFKLAALAREGGMLSKMHFLAMQVVHALAAMRTSAYREPPYDSVDVMAANRLMANSKEGTIRYDASHDTSRPMSPAPYNGNYRHKKLTGLTPTHVAVRVSLDAARHADLPGMLVPLPILFAQATRALRDRLEETCIRAMRVDKVRGVSLTGVRFVEPYIYFASTVMYQVTGHLNPKPSLRTGPGSPELRIGLDPDLFGLAGPPSNHVRS